MFKGSGSKAILPASSSKAPPPLVCLSDSSSDTDYGSLGTSLGSVSTQNSDFTESINNSDSNDSLNVSRTKADHAEALGKDRQKRLEYLLRQTEIFSHFMKSAVAGSNTPEKTKSTGPGSGRPKKNELKAQLVQSRENVDDTHRQPNKDIPQFESSPSFIQNTKMRDYQIRGLNWLISLYENGINGILADEMGLGKTIQTISLLGYLLKYRQVKGPHLVIVPLSTVSNWQKEVERWCPSLKAITFVCGKDARPEYIKNVLMKKKWNICITTYDIVLRTMAALQKFHWVYLIVDEGHRLKNENSKFSRYVRGLKSKNRLLLTGTPLQNNLHELWALLNMLLPDVFNSAEDFDSWFDTDACLGNTTMVERLHGILRPFLLRRIKADVEKSLLPKKEIKVYVGLSEMQKEWYRKVLLDDVQVIRNGVLTKFRMDNVLMHLRKVCNHPYLFPSAEPGPPYTTDSHVVTNCGKMVVLDKLLPKLHEEGSRVLIFSQFPTMIDILEDYLLWKKWKYCRLDGSQTEGRQASIDDYNSKNSDKFIFLLSTRAGGLGINLATADVVIIYDSDWNPQMDLQATDRCHRIGQKKQVRVFRLITEHTIDEKIVERAEVKLHLDRKVIQQGRLLDSGTNAPSKAEMMKLVRFGAESIIASKESSTVTDESIDEILARSKVRADDLNAKLASYEEETLRNFTIDEPPPINEKDIPLTSFPVTKCHDFEGLDYKALRERKRNKRYQEEEEMIASTGRRHRDSDVFSGADADKEEANDPSYSPPWLNPCLSSSSKTPSSTVMEIENVTPILVDTDTPVSVGGNKSTRLVVTKKSLDSAAGIKSSGRLKKPKPLFDFQFSSPRLLELYFQQLDKYNKSKSQIPLTLMQGATVSHEDQESFLGLEKVRISNCKPLTPEEDKEFKDLMTTSFTKMTKPRFMKYWTIVATLGFENLDVIVDAMVGMMEPEDIVAYHQTFLRRYVEMCDVERLLEQHNQRSLIPALARRKQLLAAKMSRYENPKVDLEITFDPPSWQGRRFKIHHDRIILATLHRIHENGDGGIPYQTLQDTLRLNPDVGWFLRTRTREELHARCNLLFHMLEKENLLPEVPVAPSPARNERVKTPRRTLSNESSQLVKTPNSAAGTPITRKRKFLKGTDETESPQPGEKIPKLDSGVD